MTIVEAIIIGLIQGATEFLPISSSGHLILVPHLLKMTQPTLAVIAIVHLGTLVAVLIYFWRDIITIVKAVLEGLLYKRPFETPEARLGWYVVVGSIPAAIVGLSLADYFDTVLGTPLVAALLLLLTAILLIIGERLLTGKKDLAGMTWGDAIFIGLSQTLALLPGVSRSGSTITAGLMRGLDRTLSARYSFLLGIPPILGAGLLSTIDIIEGANTMAQIPTLAAAFLAAAISGYACIHFLLTWLRQRSLYIFAIYCVAFSLVNLALLWFGII
jgi:undecaprenyl-diphosphatase